MKIFRPLHLLLLAVWMPSLAGAVPAEPRVHRLRQADGATFPARQWGDEFFTGWETEDGLPIVFQGELKSWTYAVRDKEGNLVPSGRRVDREPPPAGTKSLRPHRPPVDRFPPPFSPQQTATALSAPSPGDLSGDSPAGMIRNLPVILVNFSDTTTTSTPADFSALLFGDGMWSFKDYYEEISLGNLTVAPGPAGITGWTAASRPHDYYGAPSGWGPPDVYPGDLVYEAVQGTDPVVDFSPYDQNGDCYVDVVAVVHQGAGQEASGIGGDIWSHSWSLSVTKMYGLSHYGPYATNDTCTADPARFVMIDKYIMQPETYDGALTTMGVFAHEYGHALGLIDLYDTDHSSEGVGDWSLMGSGSWGGVVRNGDRPVHPDPWSKTRLGWLTPVLVTASEQGKSISAVETGGEVFRFPNNPSGGMEYFMMENRQPLGFDAALPASGVLVWHIDDSVSGNTREWYPGCTGCTGHYRVALVQADNRFHLEQMLNRGDGGDPFPGTEGNRAFTPATAPAALLYAGGSAGFALAGISNSGPVMTADVTIYDLTPPVTTIENGPPQLSNSSSGVFTFRANEPAGFTCRLDGGSAFPCTSPHQVEGLSDGVHSFSVEAMDAAGNAEIAPPEHSWTIDTTPPTTTLTLFPPKVSGVREGTFGFGADEGGTTFSCAIDRGNPFPCASPFTTAPLADGGHLFTVSATDQAGNSGAPTARGWTVSVDSPCNAWSDGACFPSIAEALDSVPTGNTAVIQLRQLEYPEVITLDRNISIDLEGGYDSEFTTRSGAAVLAGIVVSSGSLTPDAVVLEP